MSQAGYSMNVKSKAFFMLGLFLLFAAISTGVLAADEFKKACENVDKFFENFQMILKVVSVGIVTIAIVFAGYQIAFAHKRISDVAPILIGGLLIGGAATIAGWFVGDFTSTDCKAAQINMITLVLLT